MTINRDFKRLVRGRMQKTGESYTAARSHLLRQPKQTPARPRTGGRAPVATDYARLAGMSDAAVKAKTGCTWDRWVWALDQAGADAWPHARIAEYVRTKYKVSNWWCQTVTVGYERIKGLRATGQRRGGSYEANKSKTMALPLSRLYGAFSQKRIRARWLPGVEPTVRSSTRNKYMRLNWPDGTPVQLGFYSKGRGKSQVTVQHGDLRDQASAARMKAFWGERLGALEGLGL